MGQLGFIVNRVICSLICESCGWAISRKNAQGHLDYTHKNSRITIDDGLFDRALHDMEVEDELPHPPDHDVIPELEGLTVYPGVRCIACPKALGSSESMRQHHLDCHPDIPTPNSWATCSMQQFHPRLAQTMFQVIPRFGRGRTLVDKTIEDIRKEMAEVLEVREYARNPTAISPWLLKTKWHEHIRPYRTDELLALAAMPKETEFPGLISLVHSYFERATDLIDHTDELVLQHLNSPDPLKE